MRYTPSVLPIDPRDAVIVLQEELERIALTVNKGVFVMEAQLMEPPDKETGTVARADGTSWNPGSGAGIYWYDGVTWNKL